MLYSISEWLGAPVLLFGGLATGFLIFCYYMEKFSVYKGTLRCFHYFEPHGFSESEIPDLTGKTFIVTGANSGLGLGITKLLTSHGADVVMACRSVKRAEDAKREIGNVKGSMTIMELDTASFASVKRFTDAFKSLKRPLNGLFLNAGIMAPPFELTEDGMESQFQVNYVAQVAIAQELLQTFDRTKPASLVFVSSVAHWHTVDEGVFTDLTRINDKENYKAAWWYGQSKLAIVHYIQELDLRRDPKSNILCNTLHPGGVKGNLNKFFVGNNPVLNSINDVAQALLYWNPEVAALTAVGAAVSPEVLQGHKSGKYYVPIFRRGETSPHANDSQLRKRVWDFTQDLLEQHGFQKFDELDLGKKPSAVQST